MGGPRAYAENFGELGVCQCLLPEIASTGAYDDYRFCEITCLLLQEQDEASNPKLYIGVSQN